MKFFGYALYLAVFIMGYVMIGIVAIRWVTAVLLEAPWLGIFLLIVIGVSWIIHKLEMRAGK